MREQANKRLKSLQTEQSSLGKKINKKVMGMIEKAETEYQELMHKKTVIETDKVRAPAIHQLCCNGGLRMHAQDRMCSRVRRAYAEKQSLMFHHVFTLCVYAFAP